MALETERREDVPVAHAHAKTSTQRMPAGSASKLAETIGGERALVLDLTETRYLDSAGIDMLFRLGERLRERRARLVLVIPDSSPLRRLVEIVGLPRSAPVCQTLEQALAACSDGG